MNHRETVLARIGTALGRAAPVTDVAGVPDAILQRIATPRRHTLPALGGEAVARLIERMEGVQTSVVRLQSRDDVPEAVRFWLEAEGIDGEITVAPALDDVDFPSGWRRGAASGTETTGVTPCLAAVAETGSVVMASSAGTPAALNFLPENHVVVLHEDQVVNHLDDVFPVLRALSTPPRAVNFVTGPSRTADIEQTLEIGAHGPRRLHVLLLPGGPPPPRLSGTGALAP